MGPGLSTDGRRIVAARAVRSTGFGFAAVLLGSVLATRGYSRLQVGALLTAVVAGSAVQSVAVGALADRLGRRRCYTAVYAGMVLAGLVFGLSRSYPLLVLVAVTGTLSTEVSDSGPATTLEQAMLADEPGGSSGSRTFGFYNAVAAIGGATGALGAGLAGLGGAGLGGAGKPPAFLFLALVPLGVAGTLLAAGLSARVEAAAPAPAVGAAGRSGRRLDRSRPTVIRLGALFAADSFAGGFVVQSFIVFYLRQRYHAPMSDLGLLFAGLGLMQTASYLAAPRIADRIGLLATMVGTHLPSNVLLAAVPFAPTLPVAAALLTGRSLLSQMDVPTRQAYLVALVDPGERTAAAALTNVARTAVRPFGPLLAALAQQLGLGAPFLAAGVLKIAYDLSLWRWFRHVPLPVRQSAPADRDGPSR